MVHCWDLEAFPFTDYFQANFNEVNMLPMREWMLTTVDGMKEEYAERMKLLGNIAVPACGALASDIIFRLHKSQQ